MELEELYNFLYELRYFDNKFLKKSFENNILINKKIKKNYVIPLLDNICEEYYKKLKKKDKTINNKYLSVLKESVKRAFYYRYKDINKYNKEILKNLNNYNNEQLEIIVLSIENTLIYESNGIFMLPDSFEFKDDKIKDAIIYRLT